MHDFHSACAVLNLTNSRDIIVQVWKGQSWSLSTWGLKLMESVHMAIMVLAFGNSAVYLSCRDWVGLGGVWAGFLISWSSSLFWQGIAGNGQCKFCRTLHYYCLYVTFACIIQYRKLLIAIVYEWGIYNVHAPLHKQPFCKWLVKLLSVMLVYMYIVEYTLHISD